MLDIDTKTSPTHQDNNIDLITLSTIFSNQMTMLYIAFRDSTGPWHHLFWLKFFLVKVFVGYSF